MSVVYDRQNRSLLGDRERSDGVDALDQNEVVGGDQQADQPEGEDAEPMAGVEAEPRAPIDGVARLPGNLRRKRIPVPFLAGLTED